MAELARFFNGAEYGAQDFAEFFSNFLETGYFSGLEVTANSTMETTVPEGSAFVEGHEYRNTTPLNLAHAAADTTNNRIDRVVIRLDRSPDTTEPLKAMIRTGTPAASPVPPDLVRDVSIYEISLAQVVVEAGKSFIEAYQITDEREDMRVCGPAIPSGNLLEDNSRTSEDPLSSYPFGLSIMRNHRGVWPTEYGIAFTVRSTYNTGFTIYKNTGSTTNVMLVRHTSLGVFQDFEYIIPEEGSNANGNYRKGPGGVQECWHTVTATYLDGATLRVQWDYPVTFATSDIVLTAARTRSTTITPNNSEIVGVGIGSYGISGAEFLVYRALGATNFASGDSMTLHVTAKGRF